MQKNIQVDEKENVISKEVGQTLHIIEEHNVLCVCLERLEKEGGEGNREWNERVQSSGGCDVRFPPPFTSH